MELHIGIPERFCTQFSQKIRTPKPDSLVFAARLLS